MELLLVTAALRSGYNEAFLTPHCGAPSFSFCRSYEATDLVSDALSSSQYANRLFVLSKLFCLNIKTYSPPHPGPTTPPPLTSPSKKKKKEEKENLALICAVNYCLLLREIHICPSVGGSVSPLRLRQMGVHRRRCRRHVFSSTRHLLHVQAAPSRKKKKNVIGCIYLRRCLPALGLCQVQGGEKTIMHCLLPPQPPTSPTFSCGALVQTQWRFVWLPLQQSCPPAVKPQQ